MKLTKEDIRKYGTKKEMGILKEQTGGVVYVLLYDSGGPWANEPKKVVVLGVFTSLKKLKEAENQFMSVREEDDYIIQGQPFLDHLVVKMNTLLDRDDL